MGATDETAPLRDLWFQWGLPQLVARPDAQPRGQREIYKAARDCNAVLWSGGEHSTPREGARTYAEYLISNGWTAADAEEAVTGAIVALITH
jgi:hypothetical protein